MADSQANESFAFLLRTYRRKRGLTQEVLAGRAGLGVRTIQGLEDGAHRPQQGTMASLAEALGLRGEERRAFERAGLPTPRRRGVEGARLTSTADGHVQPRAVHNLGAELDSFIGRDREIADLETRLTPGTAHSRLVTLTGAGGCGKTRLARRVARVLADRYAHGVWFVDFASLADPIAIPATIVAALGLPEQPGRPAEVTLVSHLHDRQLMLVLDNCEHLLDAAAHVATLLLEGCPQLRILATSRERLRVTGEVAIRLASLAAPPVGPDGDLGPTMLADLESYEAVRLFLERARAVEPGFSLTPRHAPAVAQICHRLDGIPLAIELAAARVATLGVEEIARRLDDRFGLLTRGRRVALPRYQTLRASLEWSQALLTDDERVLFRRLAVFAGGFPLEAAEAVASGGKRGVVGALAGVDVLPTLAGLIEKSLVHVEERDGEVRYGLLETVRQYAWEKLAEADEEAAVRQSHLDWCCQLAAQERLVGYGPRWKEVLRALDRELDNLRAALDWCKSKPAHHGDGLTLAGTLWDFWRFCNHMRDGRRYLTDFLALPTFPAKSHAHAVARFALGQLAFMTGHPIASLDHLREAVSLFEETGPLLEHAYALSQLGLTFFELGDTDEAERLQSAALALIGQVDDSAFRAQVYFRLGMIAHRRGDPMQAVSLLEESRARRRQLGNQSLLAYPTFELGHVVLEQGDLVGACALMRESLLLWHGLGDLMGIAIALDGLAWVAFAQKQIRRTVHLAAAAAVRRELAGAIVLSVHEELIHITQERARADLGEDDWQRAWAEGQTMADADVIAYAMSDEWE